MNYILIHFNAVSRTPGFEEMGRTNVELGKLLIRRYEYKKYDIIFKKLASQVKIYVNWCFSIVFEILRRRPLL